MTVIFLISIDDLKQLGLIHDNVDTKIIKYSIKTVQDMNIQSALGSPLYREMLRRQDEGDWNTAYRLLNEDYIAPTLAAWVNYRIVAHLNNKITNKTVGSGQDENVTANTVEQNNAYKGMLRKDAEHYTNRLIGFLKDNETTYPEYCEDSALYEDVEKQKNKGGGLSGWIKV